MLATLAIWAVGLAAVVALCSAAARGDRALEHPLTADADVLVPAHRRFDRRAHQRLRRQLEMR